MKSVERLKELEAAVATMLREVETNFIKLPNDVLNYKQHPTQWSILECFEHLNRYARYYLPRIEQAIAGAAPATGDEAAASTWMGRKFIAMMHPANVKKQRTLRRMNPLNSTLHKGVLEEFAKHQQRLLGILQQASGVRLANTHVAVEFLRLLKMNVGDALEFVIVHQQRHLLQAQRQEAIAFLKPGPALKV